MKHRNYFFSFTKGLIAFCVMELNIFVTFFYLMEVVKIYTITLVLMMISVWISFIQMHQAVNLIKRANRQQTLLKSQFLKNQSIISRSKQIAFYIQNFFEFHTKVFTSICKMNKVFGNILLKVIICNCKYLFVF